MNSTKGKVNVHKYMGPTSLKQIEARLLEIETEKPARIYNNQENYLASIEDEIEAGAIEYLDIEKAQLELKRKFILDRRQGWRARLVWSIIAPIIVALITTYLISLLKQG